MNKTPIEAWIETWGTNLDWEAKAKLWEAVQAEKNAELKDSIGELEKSFGVKDTPENRMKILHKINERKGKIASDIVRSLAEENLTTREAISILKDTETIIMQSRFVLRDDD